MRTKEGTGNSKKQGRQANIPKKSRIRKRRKRKRGKREEKGRDCVQNTRVMKETFFSLFSKKKEKKKRLKVQFVN